MGWKKKKKDLWGVGLNLLGSMLVFICYAPPAISIVPHIPSGTVSVSETSALKLCLGYRAFMPLTVNTSKISRAHPSFSLVPALPAGESKLPSLLLSWCYFFFPFLCLPSLHVHPQPKDPFAEGSDKSKPIVKPVDLQISISPLNSWLATIETETLHVLVSALRNWKPNFWAEGKIMHTVGCSRFKQT